MPNMFSITDYRRCYVLYENVASNIPRWGRDGEPGAWNYARGVLVELCRRLDGTPCELVYRELETADARLPFGSEVTAILRLDRGLLVKVTTLIESAPYGKRGDFWQVTVNGAVPNDGTDRLSPSSPRLAHLVQQHLRRLAPAESPQQPGATP